MMKRTMKFGAVLVAVIAVVLVAAAVILPSNASEDGYTIRANINKDCSGTPWFVGDEKGYFDAYDVNVVDRGALAFNLQAAALVSGQVDVIDVSPTMLVNLVRTGAQAHAVALSQACPEEQGGTTGGVMHWLVLEKSGYQDVHDLLENVKKPKIGVAVPGFCMELDAAGWYEDNGIKMGAFEFVIIPNPQLEDLLRQGAIDAAVLPQSFYDVVFERGGLRSIATSSDTSSTLGETSLIIFTDEFIKKNPDAVRAFIQAYKGAERWANDYPEEAAEITSHAIDLHHVTSHNYSDSGRITDDVLQPWIDAMVMDGTIKEGSVAPSDLYTDEFSDLWVNSTGPQPLDPFPSSEHGTADVLDDEAFAAIRARITP